MAILPKDITSGRSPVERPFFCLCSDIAVTWLWPAWLFLAGVVGIVRCSENIRTVTK
jgi:hypothetical protein